MIEGIGYPGGMKLYHGTNERLAKSIVRIGIVPRRQKKGNYTHTVESNSRSIYLTDSAFCLHFAGNATKFPADGRLALFEIDTKHLNPASLFADEDAAEQMLGDMPHLTREQRTIFFRDRLVDLALAGFGWQESLNGLGTCSYMDEIIPRALTRVAYINKTARVLLVMNGVDPTISRMNRSILGDHYKKMIACIFGDDEPYAPTGEPLEDMLHRRITIHPDTWKEIRAGITVEVLD